jgi:hypothetical protein
MFMIVDYTDSTAAAQTDTDIPLASDSMITALNNHPLWPVPVQIRWWFGLGLTMTRVRLSAPKVKPIVRPVLSIINQAATVGDPLKIFDYWRHSIMLNAVEETQMLRSNTTAVAERDHVVLAVGDGNLNVPQGEMYVARATTVFTPTANLWSTGALTMDDQLQVGRYSIIGMRCNDATGIAARLIFPGAPIQGGIPNIRPGVVCRANVGQSDYFPHRYGGQGELGQFESFAMPVAEVMDAGPTANPEFLFDIVVVRIGARAA